MTKLERDVEKKLVNAVKSYGGMCLKWVCPGWAGVPDRIILAPGGRLVFAEIKRPAGGIIGPRQEWWKKRLESLGFEHFFVYNDQDIIMVLKAIKNPSRAEKGGENSLWHEHIEIRPLT